MELRRVGTSGCIEEIVCEGEVVEKVEEFKYLGVMIN